MNILVKRELIRPSAIQAPETGKRFRNIDYNSLFIGKDNSYRPSPCGANANYANLSNNCFLVKLAL